MAPFILLLYPQSTNKLLRTVMSQRGPDSYQSRASDSIRIAVPAILSKRLFSITIRRGVVARMPRVLILVIVHPLTWSEGVHVRFSTQVVPGDMHPAGSGASNVSTISRGFSLSILTPETTAMASRLIVAGLTNATVSPT